MVFVAVVLVPPSYESSRDYADKGDLADIAAESGPEVVRATADVFSVVGSRTLPERMFEKGQDARQYHVADYADATIFFLVLLIFAT